MLKTFFSEMKFIGVRTLPRYSPNHSLTHLLNKGKESFRLWGHQLQGTQWVCWPVLWGGPVRVHYMLNLILSHGHGASPLKDLLCGASFQGVPPYWTRTPRRPLRGSSCSSCFTLYTADFISYSDLSHLQKDESAIVVCCDQNQQLLNMNKTKELLVDVPWNTQTHSHVFHPGFGRWDALIKVPGCPHQQ